MIKKILFAALVLVALLAGVYGYFYLKNLKKPKVLCTQAIPADCAFVLESDDFLKLFNNLNESSLIWDELLQIDALKELNSNAALIDSLVCADEKMTAVFASNKVYIAAYPAENKKYDYLFALNLPDINYTEDVITYLKGQAQQFEAIEVPGAAAKINKVVFRQSPSGFYCVVNSGLVLLSTERAVIERALTEQNKNPLSLDPDFMKLEESAGKGNDFRVFVHHTQLNALSSCLDQKNIASPLFKPMPHKGWTELDADLTTNEVLLNGFTLADSSVFLSALKHQQPQEIECTAFMPAATSAFMFMGIGDYSLLAKDLGSLQEKADLETYSARLDVNLQTAIQQLAGNELAVLRTREGDTGNVYGLLKVNDREAAEKFLTAAADSSVLLNEKDSLYFFYDPQFFNSISLGACPAQLTCCCLTGDYLLFGESREGVAGYVASLAQNKTLKLNANFSHFTENNLGTEVNFYVYAAFAGSEDLITGSVNESLKQVLNGHRQLFTKFNAAAYQLVNYKGGLLNQAYLLYSPVSKQENTSVWEAQLDTTVSMKPVIVMNHKTGTKEVFIQDEAGTIYLVSNTGKIQWKKKIEGKIMGRARQVDYFKNEKLQLLFNTADEIHLLDRNGNYVQGYPIRLPSPATAEIAVFDYEANKDYRILVPCADKKVYNYNISGKLTEGFAFPVTADKISLPVQWLRINQKDYLLAADLSGNIYVTGRRGETRLSLKNKIVAGCEAWFIDAGKDISKSYIHFTDAENKTVNRLSLADVLTKNNFDCEFRIRNVSFAYVNDDALVDCILSDETGFLVIDDLGKPIVTFNNKENIDPLIGMEQVNDQPAFLVREAESGKCLAVDLAGKEEKNNFPPGKTLPVITSFMQGGEKYSLSCAGSILYCFSLN